MPNNQRWPTKPFKLTKKRQKDGLTNELLLQTQEGSKNKQSTS